METSKSIQFFNNLMSPTKEIRTQAEKDLEILKKKNIRRVFSNFSRRNNMSKSKNIPISYTTLQKSLFR